MRIDILTLFPLMFSPLEESIIGRARENGLLDIKVTNIRDFAKDKHNTADDAPYGGGPGMVMKPELIFAALQQIKSQIPSTKSQTNSKSKAPNSKQRVILLSPAGRTLNQEIAKELAGYEHLILICGHYEGIDQRVIDKLVDEEISIGDYVLTGGELPAMVLIDAIARHIPGVLGDKTSTKDESFAEGLLEYPQYTRPNEFMGENVPEVLTGGNHKDIKKWRRKQSIINTFYDRPDLLSKADITRDDMESLKEIFYGK